MREIKGCSAGVEPHFHLLFVLHLHSWQLIYANLHPGCKSIDKLCFPCTRSATQGGWRRHKRWEHPSPCSREKTDLQQTNRHKYCTHTDNEEGRRGTERRRRQKSWPKNSPHPLESWETNVKEERVLFSWSSSSLTVNTLIPAGFWHQRRCCAVKMSPNVFLDQATLTLDAPRFHRQVKVRIDTRGSVSGHGSRSSCLIWTFITIISEWFSAKLSGGFWPGRHQNLC